MMAQARTPSSSVPPSGAQVIPMRPAQPVANVPTKIVFSFSDEQKAVFQEIERGTGNILVIARAGTGKTFAIMNGLPLVRRSSHERIAILAFNAPIVAEIQKKVSEAGIRMVDVCTFHSVGSRVLTKAFPKAKLDKTGKKLDYIFDKLQVPQGLQSMVASLMNMASQRGVGVTQTANDLTIWKEIVDYYDIDANLADDDVMVQLYGREKVITDVCRYARQALALNLKMVREGEWGPGLYTFSDMLYLPLYLNLKLPLYRFVALDEGQDSNALRREMARRMMGPKGRILICGDDSQAIYSFAGADSDAMDIIKRDFGCKVLKLTETRRCSKAVVREANVLVPDYRAFEGNPEGSVQQVSEDEFEKMVLVPGKDAVICRNTKPLVQTAYKLLKRDIPAHVEGKEIGGNLVALIDRFSVKSLSVLRDRLVDYRSTEMEKLMKAKKDMLAEALADKVEAILFLIDAMPSGSKVPDLVSKIEAMFADTKEGEDKPTVALMTAHRSKGREFPRVFLLGRAKYMPSKSATKPHQIEQEHNLEYVAITRAIETLVDVIM